MEKIGVGLILMARDTSRILVLKELKNKPLIQKEAGMISFPLETIKPNESKEAAVQRLVQEEIGVDLEINPTFFGGEMSIVTNAKTSAAYAFCDKEFTPSPNDPDVEFFGWLLPHKLLGHKLPKRLEVTPIIKQFLDLFQID